MIVFSRQRIPVPFRGIPAFYCQRHERPEVGLWPIAVLGSYGPGHAVPVSCAGLGRPMMDLGSWLRSLGLAQDEAAFR